jgi:hypothetical protein
MDKFIPFLTKYVNNDLKNFLKYEYIYLADYQKDNNIIILRSVNDVLPPIKPYGVPSPIITSLTALASSSNLGSKLLEIQEYLKAFRDIVLANIITADDAIANIKIYINNDDVIIELIRKDGPCYMGELPMEMINHIAEYLDLKDSLKFLNTSSKYQGLIKNPFWYSHLVTEFPILKSGFNLKYEYSVLLKSVVKIYREINKKIKPVRPNRYGRVTVNFNNPVKPELNNKMLLDEIYTGYYSQGWTGEEFHHLVEFLAYEHHTHDLCKLIQINEHHDLIDYVFQGMTAEEIDDVHGYDLVLMIFKERQQYLPSLLKISGIQPIQFFLNYLDDDEESYYQDRRDDDSTFFSGVLLEDVLLITTHPNNTPEDYSKLMEWLYCFDNNVQDYLYENYWNLLNIAFHTQVFKKLCSTTQPNMKLIVKIANLDAVKTAYA